MIFVNWEKATRSLSDYFLAGSLNVISGRMDGVYIVREEGNRIDPRSLAILISINYLFAVSRRKPEPHCGK